MSRLTYAHHFSMSIYEILIQLVRGRDSKFPISKCSELTLLYQYKHGAVWQRSLCVMVLYMVSTPRWNWTWLDILDAEGDANAIYYANNLTTVAIDRLVSLIYIQHFIDFRFPDLKVRNSTITIDTTWVNNEILLWLRWQTGRNIPIPPLRSHQIVCMRLLREKTQLELSQLALKD